MRAVVYKGPYEVAVEDKPYPKFQNPTDCILKVTTSALCGSDLHFYRGHLNTPGGFTCGHEFVGEIVEKGSEVSKFSEGEKVSLTQDGSADEICIIRRASLVSIPLQQRLLQISLVLTRQS